MSVITRTILAAGIGLIAATTGTQAQEAAFDKYPDIVDYAFVKERALLPPLPNVVLIDSRPTKGRYDPGHIPGSINISDTFFDKEVSKLPEDKSKMLLFYCGGLDCPLSHKSAFKAKALGYNDIKVYAAGLPDWEAKGELVSVSLAYVKNLVDKPDGTVLIDSRPKKRFDEGSIPGAISIPDTFFDKNVDKLPMDKAASVIFFCGGLSCDLSSKSATKAKALGYTNVRVFAEGEPAWTKAYGAAAAPASALAVGAGGDTVVTASFIELAKTNPGAVHIVDVRDAKDFARGHFPTAKNIPIGDLEKALDTMPTDKPTVFVCATGARSSEAYDIAKMLRPELVVQYLDAEVTYGTGFPEVKERVKK